MSEITIVRDAKSGRFKQGNIGGGRPRGARSKLGEQFLSDLQSVWQTHGKAALIACAETEPAQFCRVLASLMPRELDVTVDIHAEVVSLLETFRSMNGGRVDRELEKMARKLLPSLIDAEPQPE